LLFRAAGNGVALEVVLEALAELEVVAVLGADAWAVAPADGARVTPGAVEPPQPATAAAHAIRALVRVIGLRMEVPEGSEHTEMLCKSL
jgi:hypothetical protein